MMTAHPEISDRVANAMRRAKQRAEMRSWLRAEAAAHDGEMAWYVARTSCRADSVAAEMERAGIEVVCPMERRWRRYARACRRYSVEVPLFGNYLFARLVRAESAWVGMLTFDGVECLLGDGATPIPMHQREIANILEMMTVFHADPVGNAARLLIGDIVIHPLGSITELRGRVVEIDPKRREALISTMLFGREMETRCGIDELEKLA